MATEKQQFHSDALGYNQLQNILDFCQKKKSNLTGRNQVLLQKNIEHA